MCKPYASISLQVLIAFATATTSACYADNIPRPLVTQGNTNEFSLGTEREQRSWDDWYTHLSKVVHRRMLFTHPFLWRYKKDAHAKLTIQINNAGDLTATVSETNDPRFANDVKQTYESLAHNKCLRFPPWTQKQAVTVEGDWEMTPRGKGGVKATTGQYEIIEPSEKSGESK
jgi:hypothetical protein